jgi:hypothetical protein
MLSKSGILFIAIFLLLPMFPSCKPSGSDSGTKAITGFDDDGKRKAFTLVPIKPEGFTSPITVASLGIVECGDMDGLQPEVTIRTIELLGAVGQLFYNGRDVLIPKAMGLRLKSGTIVHQDARDNIPILACSVVGDPVPFNYSEVSYAANQLAQKIRAAKSFEQIKDDFLTAQTIFLAMRGATELDSKGRPSSLDGAPLLAQLEIMSGTSAKTMAKQMATQDTVFNPCITTGGEGSGILKGQKAQFQYFRCGKKFTAAGKSFHHYEVGGQDRTYSYSAIRDRLATKLKEARNKVIASKKGASLTGGFSLQDGAPASQQPAPPAQAPAQTPQPQAAPAAPSVSQTAQQPEAKPAGFEPTLQVLPANFADKDLYKGVIKDNVTGDTFARTNDASTFFKVNQVENGYAPTEKFSFDSKTSDGGQWKGEKAGDLLKINTAGTIAQQWDASGNLKNADPSPYAFNFKPGTGKEGDNGTFQFMKGDKAIGPAMPAVLSEDKKYVGMRPEDQTKLAELALQEATKDGAVDPTVLAQVKQPLETANKVSFYRDKDGKLNDASFGNVFNVLNEKVASSNVGVARSELPAQAKEQAAGPQPGDTRDDEVKDDTMAKLVKSNAQMRDAIQGLTPVPGSGQASVDPTLVAKNMKEVDQSITAMQAELTRLNSNENKIANPSDVDVKDRARSDLVQLKSRQLQATLDELKTKKALGEKYSTAIKDGYQSGPNGSSYELAYQGLTKLPNEMEELQKKAASQMTELNNLSQPYMPLTTTQEQKNMLAHQQGMVQNQINDLYSRRERIQSAIRDARTDAANFDQVTGLEEKLARVQTEIDDRKKVLGNPYYVPSKI